MRNIFQAAGQRKHGQLLEKIMRGEDFRQRDENGLSPLMWAVIRGSVDTVRVLTEAGASPNEYDVVSLHLLKRIAGFYLRDELNFRDVFPDTNAPDIQFRSTPLHMAVLRGYDKMIAELVRHGGDATLRTECELPLLQGDAYVLLESFCWGAGDECRAATERPDYDGECSGWVLKAPQSAFYQLLHAPDFKSALVDIVSSGGDTDTNAAIAGPLLAAIYGPACIPTEWLDKVREANANCYAQLILPPATMGDGGV